MLCTCKDGDNTCGWDVLLKEWFKDCKSWKMWEKLYSLIQYMSDSNYLHRYPFILLGITPRCMSLRYMNMLLDWTHTRIPILHFIQCWRWVLQGPGHRYWPLGSQRGVKFLLFFKLGFFKKYSFSSNFKHYNNIRLFLSFFLL